MAIATSLGGALIAQRDDEFFQSLREIQRSAARCPLRSIAGWCIAVFKRCPAEYTRNAKTRGEWRSFLIRIRVSRRCIIRDSPRIHSTALPQRQMKLFGAMVSFEIKGDRAAAMALPNHTRIFTRATSLGGVESLIEHRQSIEGPDTRTPETLLRLSIGLEHPDDLIADLDRALAS